MRLIKMAIANIDTTVGALRSNTDKAIGIARKMIREQVTIAVFPEQTISGYPPEDLVQWEGFVSRQWDELKRFAKETNISSDGVDIVPTVFVIGVTVDVAGDLYNCAAFVSEGKIIALYPKQKLPTYGVFYEERTFSAGIPGRIEMVHGVPMGQQIVRFAFGTVAALICEDIWSPRTLEPYAYEGVELIVVPNSSPFRAGIPDTRKELIATRAADYLVTIAYANQLGGNDSLVFDGGGFVNQGGRMLLEAPRWTEGFSTVVVDLERMLRLRRENTTWRRAREEYKESHSPLPLVEAGSGPYADKSGHIYPVPTHKNFFIPADVSAENPRHQYFKDLLEAKVRGLEGYFRKTGAFNRIVIALSGGYDSSLTLAVARLFAERRFAGLPTEEKAAKIKDFIHCFSLPTRINSEKTKSIARNLADTLGVSFKEISIEEQVASEMRLLESSLGSDDIITRITRQNVQARIRCNLMWNLANVTGGMWLQTGNMSEKAVGYTTMGGDIMGAYSLLGNIPKTVVMEEIKYLNENHDLFRGVFDDLLTTRPSAELEEGQEDEKDLMPFPMLDMCIALFAGEKKMPIEVYRVIRQTWSDEEFMVMRPGFQPGMIKAWVRDFVRRFRISIFKWVQSPQSVHVGGVDLDRERALQLPVVQSDEWLMFEELDRVPDY